MFRLIGLCLKMFFFSLFVLVLGNLLQWKGRTISDQVKVQMIVTEKSPWLISLKGWVQKISRNSSESFMKKGSSLFEDQSVSFKEEFSSSERKKLKNLIQELNDPRMKSKVKSHSKSEPKS